MKNLYKALTLVSVILVIVAAHLWGFPAFLRYLYIPVGEYDYTIFQDGALIKAKNGKNGAVDFSSTNASAVLNQAITQGNIIYIKSGEYTLCSDTLIHNKSGVRIVGYGASLKCNGKKIIIKGDSDTSSRYNILAHLELINGTVRIENSFGTTIANMVFRNCTAAIELVNTDTWSEGTKIEDCHFINSLEGIVFRTPIDPGTKSYANTKINRCFFNLNRDNSTGIKVEEEADFTDSLIQNVRIWTGEFSQRNQSGILVEGSMLQTLLQNVVFESFAESPINLYGMKIGRNTEPPILGEGLSFLGNWTAGIYNPFSKWIFGLGGAFKRENIYIPIGLNDGYGLTQIIDAYRQNIATFKARIQVGGTFSYGETLMVRFRLKFVDNTISGNVEKSFNQTATVWLDEDDYFELVPTQNMIRELLVDAKTDSSSTNTTVHIDVYGTTD